MRFKYWARVGVAAAAGYAATGGANDAGIILPKTQELAGRQRQEIILPQSALMTFARQKDDAKQKLADSLLNNEVIIKADTNYKGNIINLIDTNEIRPNIIFLDTSQQVTPNIITMDTTQAGQEDKGKTDPATNSKTNNAQTKIAVPIDSTISIMSWKTLNGINYPNVIQLAPAYYEQFTPRQQDEYVAELDAKMQRIYLPQDRESYMKWKAELENFLAIVGGKKQVDMETAEKKREQDSLIGLMTDSVKSRIDSLIGSIMSPNTTTEEAERIGRIRDSLLKAETMKIRNSVLQLEFDTIPHWKVAEFVQNLAEYDGSRGEGEFKLEIAGRFFPKFRRLVEAAYAGEVGLRELLDDAMVKEIDVSQAEVYGRSNVSLSTATPARLFNYILVAYLYNAAKSSCEKSVPTGSLTYGPDEMKKRIIWSVLENRKLLADEFKAELLLRNRELQRILPRESAYLLTVPPKVRERVDRIAARITAAVMDISELDDSTLTSEQRSNKIEKIREEIPEIKERLDELMKDLKEMDRELGNKNDEDRLAAKCGWIQEPYGELLARRDASRHFK